MKVLMIILFFSLASCGSINRVKGTKQMDARAGLTSSLHVKVPTGNGIPRLSNGTMYTAWIHGHELQDGSYFKGGEVIIIDTKPSWIYEERK